MLAATLALALAAAAAAPRPAAAPAAPALDEASLASPLTGKPAQAGPLLEAGKDREALAALGHATRPEARFLRALALEGSGEPARAVKELEGLEAKLPALADRIAALRGRCLAAQGRHAEAARAFAAVPGSSLKAPDARIARARALVSAGAPAEALEALAPLLEPAADEPHRATALLMAGGLRAAATPPDPEGAREAYLTCWIETPALPEAVPCRAALGRLPGEAGRPPSREEELRRAEGLLERNRLEPAVALLQPLVKGLPAAAADEPLACRARAALGRALRRERRNAESAELLRPVASRCADPAVRERAAYVLASAVSASGDRDLAIALYRRFAREAPGSPLADDALLSAADLLARAGRAEEAREALAELVRDHPGGDRRDEARFRLAWMARRAGDQAAAAAALLAIEEEARGVDPYEAARAAYWRARILSGQGEAGRDAAQAIWRALIEAGPADYYALLARARLEGSDGVALPEPVGGRGPAALRLEPGKLAEDPHFAEGLLLLRLGLATAAAEELRAVDRARAGEGAVLALAALLDRAGDHRTAHQLLRVGAREALRRLPVGPARRVWEVAYPPAYAAEVVRWAPKAGVPPELLQAIMREESALDPEAVSAAGAIGLTQLMLPTARELARRQKMARPGPDDLKRPEVSIRLGAAHLGDLLRTFHGQPALAVASYNAGAGAVARWRAAGAGLELDDLVEEIPYDETRGYVKRVLRSWAAYRLLGVDRSAAQAAPSRPARRGG